VREALGRVAELHRYDRAALIAFLRDIEAGRILGESDQAGGSGLQTGEYEDD
jgi:hypothetical protein